MTAFPLTLPSPLLAVLAAVALAGCAVFQPPPLAVGQSEPEVVALLGAPTGRYPMAEGVTRLEFARGPFGRQTWMVDIGPDGRSRRFDQVLNTMHFAQFAERAPGLSVDDLLRTLGRLGRRRGLVVALPHQRLPVVPGQHRHRRQGRQRRLRHRPGVRRERPTRSRVTPTHALPTR
jgi:hypothetical protein